MVLRVWRKEDDSFRRVVVVGRAGGASLPTRLQAESRGHSVLSAIEEGRVPKVHKGSAGGREGHHRVLWPAGVAVVVVVGRGCRGLTVRVTIWIGLWTFLRKSEWAKVIV